MFYWVSERHQFYNIANLIHDFIHSSNTEYPQYAKVNMYGLKVIVLYHNWGQKVWNIC